MGICFLSFDLSDIAATAAARRGRQVGNLKKGCLLFLLKDIVHYHCTRLLCQAYFLDNPHFLFECSI